MAIFSQSMSGANGTPVLPTFPVNTAEILK
jgi:hypothetical protein